MLGCWDFHAIGALGQGLLSQFYEALAKLQIVCVRTMGKGNRRGSQNYWSAYFRVGTFLAEQELH